MSEKGKKGRGSTADPIHCKRAAEYMGHWLPLSQCVSEERQRNNLPASAKGSPGDVSRVHSGAWSSCCVWRGCHWAKCLL